MSCSRFRAHITAVRISDFECSPSGSQRNADVARKESEFNTPALDAGENSVSDASTPETSCNLRGVSFMQVILIM